MRCYLHLLEQHLYSMLMHHREEQTLHHGVTVASVVGEYTKSDKAMIHTVCKRVEAIKLRTKIKEIDPRAFVIITTSSEIVGRGFRSV